MAKITIDDKEYETDDLSDEAKSQLISMQWSQNEIQRTSMHLAALQTARLAYGRALKEALGEDGGDGEDDFEIEGEELKFD